MGNNRLAGNAARNCAKGWIFSASFRSQTDLDANRNPNQGSYGDQHNDASQREKAELQSFEHVVPTHPGGDVCDNPPRCKGSYCGHSSEPHDVHGARSRMVKPDRPLTQWGETPPCEPVQQQTPGAGQRLEEPAALEQVEKPGTGRRLSAGLFEAEFIRPGGEWPEHQLVIEDNYRDHRQDHPTDRGKVFFRRRLSQIGADPRQGNRPVADRDRLAGHDEKPAPGHAHHHVPDEAGHRERDLQAPESLPCRETEAMRCLLEVAGHRAQ